MTTAHSPIAATAGLRDRRANALREGLLIAGRDALHQVREPWGVVFGLAFNVMLILMFGFLFGGAIEIPGGGDYIAFLLPGMFALAMLFGLESTMTAIAEDAKRGITDRFRSLPISSASVALGRAIADLGSSALSLAVLMVGGLLIGWYPTTGPAEIAIAVVLLLWLRFALLWLGIFLGLHFRGPGATTAVQVLVWPIGFLSTVFVSDAFNSTDDIYFDVSWSHWLADLIPGTRKRVEFEGARIFFPEERWREFNHELRAHWLAAAGEGESNWVATRHRRLERMLPRLRRCEPIVRIGDSVRP